MLLKKTLPILGGLMLLAAAPATAGDRFGFSIRIGGDYCPPTYRSYAVPVYPAYEPRVYCPPPVYYAPPVYRSYRYDYDCYDRPRYSYRSHKHYSHGHGRGYRSHGRDRHRH